MLPPPSVAPLKQTDAGGGAIRYFITPAAPLSAFARSFRHAARSAILLWMWLLVERGCIVTWSNVRISSGPSRPRLIQALSAEKTKTSSDLDDTRPLNEREKSIRLSGDTVKRVAAVASSGCCQSSLDDKSAILHLLLRPSSWPILAFRTRASTMSDVFFPSGLAWAHGATIPWAKPRRLSFA